MSVEALPSAQPTFNHLRRPDAIYPALPNSKAIEFDPLSLFQLPQTSDFIDSQGRLGVRNGNPQHLQPVAEYWGELGMPSEIISTILDSEGKLQYRISDEVVARLFEQDPLSAGREMVKMLQIFYGNSQYALNRSVKRIKNGRLMGEDGMAPHDEHHADDVVIDSNRFILEASPFREDIDLQQVYETAFSAAGHDVGQSIQTLHRTGQEQASVFLLRQVMPTFAEKYPQYWESMVRAIMLHPEANLTALIGKVNTERKQLGQAELTSDESIQLMYDTLSPAALALILADKLQIGQHRLPPDWREFNGLLRDWHIAVNACYTARSAGYSEDGKIFRVNFEYTAGPENDRKHPATITPDGKEKDRFWMPDPMDEPMRRKDWRTRAAHSEVAEAMMWDVYGERLKLTIMTAFALNPATETVEINFKDNNAWTALRGLLPPDRIDEIANRTYKFRRDNIEQIFELTTGRLDRLLGEKDGMKYLDYLKQQGHELRPLAPDKPGNDRRFGTAA